MRGALVYSMLPQPSGDEIDRAVAEPNPPGAKDKQLSFHKVIGNTLALSSTDRVDDTQLCKLRGSFAFPIDKKTVVPFLCLLHKMPFVPF